MLYRVRDRLADAGLGVELSTGLSDEGDPWAAFEQNGSGDVLVSIAWIDGELVVANAATGAAYRGRDLRAIADAMLERVPLGFPRNDASNVVMHPRSVLTVFVAAGVVLAETARSIERAQASEHTERDACDTHCEEGFLV